MKCRKIYDFSAAGTFVTVEDLINRLSKIPKSFKIEIEYSAGVGVLIVRKNIATGESTIKIKPYDLDKNYKKWKA